MKKIKLKKLFAFLLCFIFLSSTISPSTVWAQTVQGVQNILSGSSAPENDTAQSDQTFVLEQDPEVALDNHPELRELWNKRKHFIAAFQWVENTLDEIENDLITFGDNFTELESRLHNLVGVAKLRVENLENKFLDLLQMFETMDGLPALAIENGRARWVRGDGHIDNVAKAWAENLLSESHQLIDKLYALQENLNRSKISEVLRHVATIRELIGMVPSSGTVEIKGLWFERWDGLNWRRTTWANAGDSVRVMIELHNTDWFARGRTWLAMCWECWYLGEWYFDLEGWGYTGKFEIYRRSAPITPGEYKFGVKGWWEAWTCWFCLEGKVGQGYIPEEERTLRVGPPAEIEGSVFPEVGGWGTTFTFSVEYTGPRVEYIKVYVDGSPLPGKMRFVSGDYETGASFEYEWVTTSGDIGTHTYQFEVCDVHQRIIRWPETPDKGPTVRKRDTALKITCVSYLYAEPISGLPPYWNVGIYILLEDEFGERLSGKGVTLLGGGWEEPISLPELIETSKTLIEYLVDPIEKIFVTVHLFG